MGNIAQAERWPQGIIPYVDPANSPGFTATEIRVIREAIAIWSEKTSIQFIPYNSQPNYVAFTKGPYDNCSSYVGMQRGGQLIKCNSEQVDLHSVLHEIGHAVGLKHEHQRSDRDRYLLIWRDRMNIDDATWARNMEMGAGIPYGQYDKESVMHYSRAVYANSSTAHTIECYTSPGNPEEDEQNFTECPEQMGKWQALSSGDIETVKAMYNVTE